MTDSVKFIFKTLIKVPVIIFFSFLVFNIFAFFFIYFKMLGVSYVIMQTAVENNYLPASEANTLYNYVDSFNDIMMVENAGVIIYAVDTSGDGTWEIGEIHTMTSASDTTPIYGDSDARTRKQYGREVTVGVQCNYKLVWPLDYRSTTVGEEGVAGLDDSKTTTFKSDSELEQDRKDAESDCNIRIVYTVPGLKYYPDMLTY